MVATTTDSKTLADGKMIASGFGRPSPQPGLGVLGVRLGGPGQGRGDTFEGCSAEERSA